MRLDVRTKLLLLLLANACFFFRVDGALAMMIVGVLLVLLYTLGRHRLALYIGLSYLIVTSLAFLPDQLLPAYAYRLVSFAVAASQLVYPSLLAALIVVKTTTVYELVHGLRKWHFPEVCLLTFAVMLRFLPMIKQGSQTIHRSLAVRGILRGKWDIVRHPKQYLEYLLVPLLLLLLRRSQELTIASLTKGLAIKKGTSETFTSRLTWKDWGVQAWLFTTMGYIMFR
ncbi:energy-coupling factor transporter transmembrane component T family protein [Streptococcus phocae subsp. phocae]